MLLVWCTYLNSRFSEVDFHRKILPRKNIWIMSLCESSLQFLQLQIRKKKDVCLDRLIKKTQKNVKERKTRAKEVTKKSEKKSKHNCIKLTSQNFLLYYEGVHLVTVSRSNLPCLKRYVVRVTLVSLHLLQRNIVLSQQIN